MKANWAGALIAALVTTSGESASAEEALADKSGCLECHALTKTNTKLAGPAFGDIAAKYRGNANARGALIQVMKKGGKGNWPDSAGAPMPPYSPRLSDAEIQRLVDWVLRL